MSPVPYTEDILQRTEIDEKVFPQIVDRIPADWRTSSARVFTIMILCYNCEQLKEIFR